MIILNGFGSSKMILFGSGLGDDDVTNAIVRKEVFYITFLESLLSERSFILIILTRG